MTTISDIFNNGCPKDIALVNCGKHSSQDEPYTSDHVAVKSVDTTRQFEIVDFEIKNAKKNILFLSRMERLEENAVEYFSEAELLIYIVAFFEDLLFGLGLSKKCKFSQGTHRMDESITKKVPVIWVVESSEGVPILVIEVKKPHFAENIVENKQVLGQLYDYLCRLRSIYDQLEVYGIATSLQDWCVCWLPDVLSAAVTTVDQLKQLTFNSSRHDLLDRSICTLEPFSISDPQLPKIVASVLLKAYYTRYEAVNLFDPKRCYITLTPNKWNWTYLKAEDIQEFTLNYPHPNCSSFYVVRYFDEGRDGRVTLVFTKGKNSAIAIIKQYYNQINYEHELTMWRELYGVTCIENSKSKYLVLPFCFHCVEDDGTPSFNFNLAFWTNMRAGANGVANLIKQKELEFFNQLTADSFNPEDIARSAITDLTNLGYVHDDLQWRHVALMPEFIDGEIIGLKPVLIYLTSIRKVDDESNITEAYMEKELQRLLNH